MSPYEITHAGASVEHWNEEAGSVWLDRVTRQWPNAVWLNPLPRKLWAYTQSTTLIAEAFSGRMFPLTLGGLEEATRLLSRRQ